MYHNERGIFQNYPVKVHMAGWESNTAMLQDAGWEVSAEQDVVRRSLRVALHHPGLQIYAMSDHIDVDYMRPQDSRRYEMFQHLRLNMVQVGAQLIYRHEVGYNPVSQFRPVDASIQPPRMVDMRDTKLEDFYIFRPIPKEELIVRPDSVPELMDKILALQDPKMNDIVKRQRLEQDRAEPFKIDNHCSIISIAA